jgi:hypothetical protein
LRQWHVPCAGLGHRLRNVFVGAVRLQLPKPRADEVARQNSDIQAKHLRLVGLPAS